jgi:hypothetical protein
MNKISLIASDIDNTLLDSKKRISPRAKEAIREADKRGIHFCLASGRAPQAMGFIQEEIGVEAALGCYSGALTLFHHTILGSHNLPFEQFQTILEKLSVFDCSTFIYGLDEWYSEKDDYWFERECKIVHHRGIITPYHTLLSESEEQGKPLFKLVIMHENPLILQKIEDRINQLDLGLEVFKSSSFFIEINPKNITKATTIRDVASFYDVPLSAVFAIGDYYNDIGMLTEAGDSVAMKGSPDDVKKCAKRISTADMDHDGFAIEIEKILHVQ